MGRISGDASPKPLRCPQDVSIEQVERSYSELNSRIANCAASATKDERKKACRLLTAAPGGVSSCSDSYWAPLHAYGDGQRVFSALRERAQKGNVVRGEIIIEADSSTEVEQHLAACAVKEISHIHGPPFGCQTVAVITKHDVWLLGQLGQHPAACVAQISYTLRPTGAINIQWTIKTHRKPDELGEAIVKMLRSDLGLTAEMDVLRGTDGVVYSISLTAVAPIRESTILPSGWRESIDFDLRIYSIHTAESLLSSSRIPDHVIISGVAHALVSRLALGNLNQYQGLDDAQRAAYATTLDKKTSAAIKAVCKTFKEIDASTLICD